MSHARKVKLYVCLRYYIFIATDFSASAHTRSQTLQIQLQAIFTSETTQSDSGLVHVSNRS